MEPLAYKIRPKSLDEFVGQEHLVGKDKPLRVAIENGHVFSFILWGPPGVGKTTLAKIYAHAINGDIVELSAVSAGKDDLKRAVEKNILSAKVKILFIDEIHRFNKAQQDFLLPYVERGVVTLVGATTENPSFEVISPLLSRCRVFVLNELNDADMRKIIVRTGFSLDTQAQTWLINMANGDARQLITMLEDTSQLYKDINVSTLTNTLQNKFLRFDKKGEEHYNTISAYIKCLRASQTNAALYYLARMVDSGEDPKFIARRLVVFASEDIGMAQPTALVIANETFRAVETIGLPECAINLAHATVHMCLAPKDRSSYDAYNEAMADVKNFGNLPIPMSIRNAPTKLMKDLGYHKGSELYTDKDLLPEKLVGKKYFKKKKSKNN